MKKGLVQHVVNTMAFWVFVICSLISVLLLWVGGGSFLDGGKLLLGVLVVGPEGEGSLRYLFWRSVRTFWTVTVAILGGLSFALAITLVAGFLGAFFNRALILVGRWLSHLAPMGLALGVIYSCVHHWELPIESLLPTGYQVASDSFFQILGRSFWAWLLPSLVLSLLVLGHGLTWFNERFLELSQQPLARGLRARGIVAKGKVFLHGFALSRESFRRALLQGLPWLLACAAVVEEAFRYPGLGEFGAHALRAGKVSHLAAYFHASGLMLGLWLGLMEFLDQRYPVKDVGWKSSPYRSKARCWESGIALGLGGILLSAAWLWDLWMPEQAGFFSAALQVFDDELVHALLAAAGASAMVIAASLVLGWTRKSPNENRSKLLQVVGVLPLMILGLCVLSGIHGKAPFGTWVLSVMLSIYGSVALWRVIRERQASTVYLASLTMGARSRGMYGRILWPTVLPYLLRFYFVSAAWILMWQCFANYFGLSEVFAANLGDITWGGQLLKQVDVILDHASPVLPPSFLLASACFTLQYLGDFISEAIKPTAPLANHGQFNQF